MTQETTLSEVAATYHEALPERLRVYLNRRGIPDSLIDLHLLGWNGRRITIPVCNGDGELVFFRLAKDPADTSHSPKMLAPRGAHVELYGWEEVWRRPSLETVFAYEIILHAALCDLFAGLYRDIEKQTRWRAGKLIRKLESAQHEDPRVIQKIAILRSIQGGKVSEAR
jgi:hypothetical protein